MNLTLSVEPHIVERARRRAESLGTSLNQLVRDYLEEVAGTGDIEADIKRFKELSGKGDSKGWKFNREELHERK